MFSGPGQSEKSFENGPDYNGSQLFTEARRVLGRYAELTLLLRVCGLPGSVR